MLAACCQKEPHISYVFEKSVPHALRKLEHVSQVMIGRFVNVGDGLWCIAVFVWSSAVLFERV